MVKGVDWNVCSDIQKKKFVHAIVLVRQPFDALHILIIDLNRFDIFYEIYITLVSIINYLIKLR